MGDLYIDLVVYIISWCDPQSLSEISLVNKRYYELMNGNKILLMLSIRHGIALESFKEYQLFCEIRCMVPQASKHYNQEFLLRNFPELRPAGYFESILPEFIDIGKCLYNENAHIDDHIIPNDPYTSKFQKDYFMYYGRDNYFRHLIRICPSMTTVIRYWERHKDVIMHARGQTKDDFIRSITHAAMISLYSIERLYWVKSLYKGSVNEYYRTREIHPHIICSLINRYRTNNNIFNFMPYRSGFTADDLLLIGSSYKYGDSVDKLAKKIVDAATEMAGRSC